MSVAIWKSLATSEVSYKPIIGQVSKYRPLIGQKQMDPWMTGFLKSDLNETSHTYESTHLIPKSKVSVDFDKN